MSDKVTICSVGDLMFCDSPLYVSVGVNSHYDSLKGKVFINCDVLKDSDVTIGNFETVVYSPKSKQLSEMQMCCSKEVIEELHDAGFSVLNIANNHIMQHGAEGFISTLKACEEYKIKPIGIKDEEPFDITINGVRLAFLSLCIHIEWYEPDCILYESSIERILNRIKLLRLNNPKQVIIVSAHWGDEFSEFPSNAQIQLAHTLVDSGANIILGHHSHVFQGIEQYHDSLIIYGQGNFISDMIPAICRKTGVIQLVVDTSSRKIRISYKLFSFYIDEHFIPVRIEGEWFDSRQRLLSKALAGHFSFEEYWKAISVNHKKAHTTFRLFFAHNFHRYKFRAAIGMILSFLVRKIKRIIGISQDGIVSSMDPFIIEELKKLED